MFYVKYTCGNGYCGCDAEDVEVYDEMPSEEEMAETAWEKACENAESFSYVHFGWDIPYTDEEYEEYLENHVTCEYEVVTREQYEEYCSNWHIEPEEEKE